MTADGSTGAVALDREGLVALVDLDAMSVIQSVDVSAQGTFCQFATISPDGSHTYVAFKDYDLSGVGLVDEVNDGTMVIIDNTTLGTSTLAPFTVSDGNLPGFLEFGPDGRLYYGRKDTDTASSLTVYDEDLGTWSAIDVGITEAAGIEFVGGAMAYVYDMDVDDVFLVDLAAGTSSLDYPVDGASFGHKMIATPY